MKSTIVGIVLGLVAVFVVASVARNVYDGVNVENGIPDLASSTPDIITIPVFDQSISDGMITIPYSDKVFGLAVREDQILIDSYIPPCSEPFAYCLYYIGDDYADTNMDSAGLRIYKRTDSAAEEQCLGTPPAGFDSSVKANAMSSEDSFAASVFSPVGDAGAGHFSSGSQYRLFIREDSSCYEIETRVAQSQFANHPEGTIEEFDEGDQRTISALLDRVIDSIEFDGRQNLFGSM